MGELDNKTVALAVEIILFDNYQIAIKNEK